MRAPDPRTSPQATALAAWRDLPTATVSDCLERLGAMDAGIAPLTGAGLVGPAHTVETGAGDSSTLHRALESAPAGAVLVVDGGGYLGRAVWGCVLTGAAQAAGVVGAVIDGAIRDVAAIREAGFVVYARGACPAGPHKGFRGRIGATVQCGGVVVGAGDLVLPTRTAWSWCRPGAPRRCWRRPWSAVPRRHDGWSASAVGRAAPACWACRERPRWGWWKMGGMSQARNVIQRAPLLVDHIARHLRTDILSGRLQPGQRIGVSSLARELGVSHIPVREAIRRLEAESLVETIPHRGPTVAGVRLEELHEIYELRRLIEREIAGSAVQRYSDEDTARISAALQRLLRADPQDVDGDFWEAHHAFHWSVLGPATDTWTERILGLLWQSAERYHRLFTLVFGSLPEAHADHRAITDAAVAKDADRLCDRLVTHLHRTEQTVTAGYLDAMRRSSPQDQHRPGQP